MRFYCPRIIHIESHTIELAHFLAFTKKSGQSDSWLDNTLAVWTPSETHEIGFGVSPCCVKYTGFLVRLRWIADNQFIEQILWISTLWKHWLQVTIYSINIWQCVSHWLQTWKTHLSWALSGLIILWSFPGKFQLPNHHTHTPRFNQQRDSWTQWCLNVEGIRPHADSLV